MVGRWQRTFPDYLPPLLAQWPNVKPFALTSPSEFRSAPPPALDSPEYAAAVDQVMRNGGYQSSQRTAEQTEIALFWADGGGTATPPSHWNRIATDLTLAKQNNLLETARTFARGSSGKPGRSSIATLSIDFSAQKHIKTGGFSNASKAFTERFCRPPRNAG